MKLSHYISLRFIGATVVILLVAIPVFYFVIMKIMQNNVDESLELQKQWILKRLADEKPQNFSIYDQNMTINEVMEILRNEDRFETKNIYQENDGEFVNHRVLDFYTQTGGKKYHIKLKKSLLENEDVLEAVVLLLIMLLSFLFFSLMVINSQVEKKIWKPFYKLLDQLKTYTIDKHQTPDFTKTPVNELNDLNNSISDLIDRNQKQYKSQKEFTENASHEMQTPIAVIQSKLELLMQTEPLSKEQAKFIENIFEAISKMSKMNKGLLLLARIENNQFGNLKEISVRQTAAKIIEDSLPMIEDKNLHYIFETEGDKMVIADETLLHILLVNLISNAIKYCNEKGFIKLELTGTQFLISNTSDKEKLDESKLFRRFQKQNSEQESNGIGLEISDTICKIYGWKLNYSYSENRHFFTVDFY